MGKTLISWNVSWYDVSIFESCQVPTEQNDQKNRQSAVGSRSVSSRIYTLSAYEYTFSLIGTALHLNMGPVSARTVLQNRALQCSFSSVFHLRKTATCNESLRESKRAESIFVNAVGIPMACMVTLGGGLIIMNERNWLVTRYWSMNNQIEMKGGKDRKCTKKGQKRNSFF